MTNEEIEKEAKEFIDRTDPINFPPSHEECWKAGYHFRDKEVEKDEILKQKQLVYEFASWLSQQNFTNPNVSKHDWVDMFFTSLHKADDVQQPLPESPTT